MKKYKIRVNKERIINSLIVAATCGIISLAAYGGIVFLLEKVLIPLMGQEILKNIAVILAIIFIFLYLTQDWFSFVETIEVEKENKNEKEEI